jgi:LmbE family N-acetylglucosaminyl deacetylase
MKTIVGIFAHPDDEAFGPSGTLTLLAKEHNVYLICVTNGDAANGKPDPELAKIRKEELEASAKLLGVKKVFFLEFGDGTLCNNVYHEVAEKIKKILTDLQPEQLITIEPKGISGHIDHIFVSMISSFIFQRTDFIKEIWYVCSPKEITKLIKDYFIYFPEGYDIEDIEKVIDVSSVWEIKKQAMLIHESQRKDAENILKRADLFPKNEYFLVKKK